MTAAKSDVRLPCRYSPGYPRGLPDLPILRMLWPLRAPASETFLPKKPVHPVIRSRIRTLCRAVRGFTNQTRDYCRVRAFLLPQTRAIRSQGLDRSHHNHNFIIGVVIV